MAERILPFELLAVAAAYAILVRRRGAQRSATIEIGRATAFLGGLGVVAIALVGPMDVESARTLSWHMAQHLLLVSVAAPLLAIGRPLGLILDFVPAAIPQRVRVEWLRTTAGTAASALVALTTLFAWHIPRLYDVALTNQTVHVAEHATLLVTSMVLWSNLIGRANLGASVVWLFVITVLTTAFGVAMTIARSPWYPPYITSSRAAAIQDQQLAGVIMWAFGGLAALVGGVGLFTTWLVSASGTPQEPATLVAEAAPTC